MALTFPLEQLLATTVKRLRKVPCAGSRKGNMEFRKIVSETSFGHLQQKLIQIKIPRCYHKMRRLNNDLAEKNVLSKAARIQEKLYFLMYYIKAPIPSY